jgi:hypothetical protein
MMLLHLYVRIVWISSIDKAGGEEKSFHLLTVWRPRSAASQPKVGFLVDLSVNTRRAGSDEEVLKKGEDYIRRGRTGWPAAVDMIDTTGWESGYYTIDFILAADKYRDLNVASLVVLPSVNHVDVLVELSTNTYQAYNVWGDIVSTKVFLSGIGGR